MLITSKAGTWELLINYFKQHYRNECTAADNLKWLLLPSCHHTVGEDSLRFYQPAIINKLFNKWSISSDLDGTEDDKLSPEQHDKSDTNSKEEGDEMYYDMMTHNRYNRSSAKSDDDDEFLCFD